MLSVAPPVISKIPLGRLPVGASLLIWMDEETNMNIGELRELIPAFLDAVSVTLESADFEHHLTQVHFASFQELFNKMLG